MLSTILSEGRSSRLYRSLVYEAQQALSAEGGYWELEEAGVFLAFASVRPDASIDRVEELFFDEIERAKRELPDADELEKAKRQLEVSLVDGLETNHELADRIGRDYTILGRIRPLDERLERIRAVTRRGRAPRRADLPGEGAAQRRAHRAAAGGEGRQQRGRRRVKVWRAAALGLVAALGLACGHGHSPFSEPPAWELPAPPPPESPVVPAGRLHRAALENGLHIIILEDPRLPRVLLGLAFRRGESSLPPESAGLASFTADLMERGAGDRDALAIAEATDRLGASLSVAAGWDSLSVVTSGLSRDQDTLLELLADVVRRPRFDPAEAARSRSETLAALERARNDPNTLTSWYTASAVYEGHRFGLPLSGTPETVAHFDAAKAREFHARIALPNDAIFFASGDVQADALIAQVRQLFGTWPQGSVMDAGAPPPAPAPPARRIVIVDRPEMAQARITLSHDGISRSSDDRVPVALMNSVIGGSGFSSRLMETLRTYVGPHLQRLFGLRAAARPGALRGLDLHGRSRDAQGDRPAARRARARPQASRPARTSSAGRARSRSATSRWGSRRRVRWCRASSISTSTGCPRTRSTPSARACAP